MLSGDLSLAWPRVVAADFTSEYTVVSLGSTVVNKTYGPYDPARVCHRDGDLQITGDVEINGILIVEGALYVTGTSNFIRAAKAMPALLVTGSVLRC